MPQPQEAGRVTDTDSHAFFINQSIANEEGPAAHIQFIMKKFIVALSLIFSFLTVAAQDVIVRRDGSQLAGKVIEVTESIVKYTKVNHQDGPIYSINTDNIMRINYENGDVDVFVDEEETVPATVLSGRTGKIRDTDLYKMHLLKENPYKVPNRIRLWGFIGGGAMIATGVGILIAIEFWQSMHPTEFFLGTGLATAGVVTIPTCFFIAQYKRKAIQQNLLTTAPIYRQDILDSNGKTLSVGMDMMADINRTHTVGLGMTFKF